VGKPPSWKSWTDFVLFITSAGTLPRFSNHRTGFIVRAASGGVNEWWRHWRPARARDGGGSSSRPKPGTAAGAAGCLRRRHVLARQHLALGAGERPANNARGRALALRRRHVLARQHLALGAGERPANNARGRALALRRRHVLARQRLALGAGERPANNARGRALALRRRHDLARRHLAGSAGQHPAINARGRVVALRRRHFLPGQRPWPPAPANTRVAICGAGAAPPGQGWRRRCLYGAATIWLDSTWPAAPANTQ